MHLKLKHVVQLSITGLCGTSSGLPQHDLVMCKALCAVSNALGGVL